MAEIIGLVASGLTIAGLFKLCVEAFDLIQAGRHQELDLKKLTLRLNIEKCRLYTWGQAMGLTDDTNEDHQRPLDMCQFQDLVKDTLEIIFQLFNDTHKLKEAYGCRPCTAQDNSQLCLGDAEEAGPIQNLAASFANFKIGGNKGKRSSNIVQKAKWVVHDRKKFNGLIIEVKDWMDALQDITKSVAEPANQNAVMRKCINNIRNIETLGLMAEVCELDHRDLSEAASTRAETLSMATSQRDGITDWTNDIDFGNDINVDSTDLESLTVTELKHRLRQLLQERETASASHTLTPPPPPSPPFQPQLNSHLSAQNAAFDSRLESFPLHSLPAIIAQEGARATSLALATPYFDHPAYIPAALPASAWQVEDKPLVFSSYTTNHSSQQPWRRPTFCSDCNDHPEGFYGDHELRRHMERHHTDYRKVWICKDSSVDNGYRLVIPLSDCKACRLKKTYGATYNAAAHLRRAHFYPCKNKRGGRGKISEGRGGMGGGKEPPMNELKNWMYEEKVEVNAGYQMTWSIGS